MALISVAVELHLFGAVAHEGDVQRVIAAFRPAMVPDKQDNFLAPGVFMTVAAHAVPQHLPFPDKFQIGLWQQNFQIPVCPLRSAYF